ncbi:FAD binding domain-containing protein [Lentibacillus daqui]|uniref:FAD binding domain-containing protein n=1 Tax=Lentibacillus daqui TaxID=2911514 RepID=UPI0022B0926A|nr:FAD binding domain-containing protein [Lentibacillus daqui]
MIAFDFEYYKPTTIQEAVTLFYDLQANGKIPHYYAGGTEFISRARMHEIQVDAVIDLKGIPDCNEFQFNGNQLVIGSAVTLTTIADSNLFPLLSDVSRAIAHRTARNKITIGGNISGHLCYREALLPFLLADSEVVIAEKKGIRTTSIHKIYQNGVQLNDGEFLIQIITDGQFSNYPYWSSKKTKHSNVNYPIVSLASMKVDGKIRVALSGVCDFPFRTEQLELVLNDTSYSEQTRIQQVLNHLPGATHNDMHGSREYREFVLAQELAKLLQRSKGVS